MILNFGNATLGTQDLHFFIINDDTGLTLTHLTAMSNFVSNALEWAKLLQSHSVKNKLAANDQNWQKLYAL